MARAKVTPVWFPARLVPPTLARTPFRFFAPLRYMQRPFGLGFEAITCTCVRPQSPLAGLLADHLKRGVRRNRRIQRIDVASEIHDGAANQLSVRATYERDAASACGLSLGGLGLRSHANCGANHRCNRNCSSDCHVAPFVWSASGKFKNKNRQGRCCATVPDYRWLRCPHISCAYALLVACPLSARSRRRAVRDPSRPLPGPRRRRPGAPRSPARSGRRTSRRTKPSPGQSDPTCRGTR